MSELPEGCITNILSFTSPRDACRSSLISSTFKSAANSDVVWEKFLPIDYKKIISRAVPPINLHDFSSKKELYFRLCSNTILLDGGNTGLKLEKKSGKKCITIGARELRIVWGDTPYYWQWVPHSGSRFAEVAELRSVWWLEISGKIETQVLSPNTTYAVYLLIDLVRDADIFGVTEPPNEATVRYVRGEGTSSGVQSVYLDPQCDDRRRPVQRDDGWTEVEMGGFYNDDDEDGEVEMSLKEVAGYYKQGLIVEGIEIRPKGNCL